jgi:hypothetical protein
MPLKVVRSAAQRQQPDDGGACRSDRISVALVNRPRIRVNHDKDQSRTATHSSLRRNGSHAGLVWELGESRELREVIGFEPGRWGVWAVEFARPMQSTEDAQDNLTDVAPQLRAKWQEWRAGASKSSSAPPPPPASKPLRAPSKH